MTDGDRGSTGVTVEDLRKRVRAAEERFEKMGRETQAARGRMVELVTALDGEREDRLDQIAGLEAQLTALKGENSELRELLTELLGVVEKAGDDDGLAGLEAELRREAATEEEDDEDEDEDDEEGDKDAAAGLSGAAVAAAGSDAAAEAVETAEAPEATVAEAPANGETEAGATEAGEAEAKPAEADATEAGAPGAEGSEAGESETGRDDTDDGALALDEEPTEPAAEAPAEPSSEEAAEKSDSETDQLDRILRSIRRITS